MVLLSLNYFVSILGKLNINVIRFRGESYLIMPFYISEESATKIVSDRFSEIRINKVEKNQRNY